MMMFASRCLALALLLLLSGCAREAAAPPTPTPAALPAAPASNPTAAASPAPAAGATTAAGAKAQVDAPKPDYPTLVVRTFDGKPWDLKEHRGRWVVVNFWATWCTPCLAEIPDLARFDAERADVDVIGLAYEEIEHADMVAFLAKRPIPYPIAVLDVYAPPADFDSPRGLPMTYLIAPDGKVAKNFFGPVTSAELAKLIDGAAGKGTVASAP